MTPRVWIERPIATVEDAEALPEGAVVLWIDPDGRQDPVLYTPNHDGEYATANEDRYPLTDADLPVTALVPVEAVEETRRELEPDDDPDWWGRLTPRARTGPLRRRYVTEWEDA